MRVRLKKHRHVAVVPARDGRRVAAQARHCAEEAHCVAGAWAVGCVGVEGVEVGWEDAGGLEGHFFFLPLFLS